MAQQVQPYAATLQWGRILLRMADYKPDSELQLYGPIGLALRFIFPLELGFIVRPQCRLVPAAHPAAKHHYRIDSHGIRVRPSNTSMGEPDFEVVMLSRDHSILLPVLVCDAKVNRHKSETRKREDVAQVWSYMGRLYPLAGSKYGSEIDINRQRGGTEPIWGFLLRGDEGELWRIDQKDVKYTGKLSDPTQPLYQKLWEIRENWRAKTKDWRIVPNPLPALQTPEWFDMFVAALQTDEASSENSFYGAAYEIMCREWPLEENYVVKPQGPLRISASEHIPDTHKRTSSYGNVVILGGVPLFRVDFLVVRFEDWKPEDLPQDRILFAVEMKKYVENPVTSFQIDLRVQIGLVCDYIKTSIGYEVPGIATIGLNAWLATWELAANGQSKEFTIPEFEDATAYNLGGEELWNRVREVIRVNNNVQ
ncbi:hypothetical protein EXIGLDRAFT_725486 [Exidia glandulosa HHB12029]|uniref:Uncharacterized protein n=1 Tax=Exidia glandulosa HHB12029 TaxID=1314781 RepID=A0A165E0R6_EXIGL|nr:hypothetical protein EXIGLDRAFT_725486 [Exidia glandulosa HHB12029]